MRKSVTFLNKVSLLLILSFHICLSGCFSSKRIFCDDLPTLTNNLGHSKSPFIHNYTVHVGITIYYIENAVVANSLIKGSLNNAAANDKRDRIEIYLTSDSLISIDPVRNILSVPHDNSSKYYFKEYDQGTGTLKSLGYVSLICLGILIITIPFWFRVTWPFNSILRIVQ